jgi:hypothetical protein
MFLFHHLVFLKGKADDFAGQKKGTSALPKHFQEDARLSPDQFALLYQAAADCEQQVNDLDKKAMTIINQMKAPYPDGRLPAGEGPPPLPLELVKLQEDRNLAVLKARDRLRLQLGEQVFWQLDAFVERRVGAQIKSIGSR